MVTLIDINTLKKNQRWIAIFGTDFSVRVYNKDISSTDLGEE